MSDFFALLFEKELYSFSFCRQKENGIKRKSANPTYSKDLFVRNVFENYYFDLPSQEGFEPFPKLARAGS